MSVNGRSDMANIEWTWRLPVSIINEEKKSVGGHPPDVSVRKEAPDLHRWIYSLAPLVVS